MPLKGHKHTEEAKAKMSAARKGCKFSAEHREHLSIAHKGLKSGEGFKGHRHSKEAKQKMSIAKLSVVHKPLKHSKESRCKMSIAKKGRIISKEHRAKLSAALKGSKSPYWLGGISRLPYSWDFTPELKEEVRRRDNHKCQLCGVPQAECTQKLDVHHIDYCKTNSDPVNLISLCRSCNLRSNKNRKLWKEYFQKMMVLNMISKTKC